jgi:uncharacterized membrane protein
MKRLIFIVILICIGGLPISIMFVTSCTHEPNFISELDTVCFEKQILPIMQTSCAMSGCHSQGGGESGFDATSYESIMSIVNPGNAKKSKLYQVITQTYAGNMMPPDNPLTEVQRNLIMVWIEQGAKKTTCPDSVPSTPDTTITTIDTLCFVQNVLPIFTSNCAMSSCHSAASHVGGYNLSDYTNIMNSGDGVVPFNPNATKIYQVTVLSGEERMPPFPSPALTANQRETIRKWIAEGAINSDCPNLACDTINPISFTNQVWPIINNNCTGCHNSSTHSGGVDLSSYNQINTYATQTRNAIPILSGVINSISGFKKMPPSGTLTQCNKRTIDLWIEQGKKNN